LLTTFSMVNNRSCFKLRFSCGRLLNISTEYFCTWVINLRNSPAIVQKLRLTHFPCDDELILSFRFCFVLDLWVDASFGWSTNIPGRIDRQKQLIITRKRRHGCLFRSGLYIFSDSRLQGFDAFYLTPSHSWHLVFVDIMIWLFLIPNHVTHRTIYIGLKPVLFQFF